MVANDAEALIRKSESYDKFYDPLHELGRLVGLLSMKYLYFGLYMRANSLVCGCKVLIQKSPTCKD